MGGRVCRACGNPIEESRGPQATYCLACGALAREGGRAWARILVEVRRRESVRHAESGRAAPKDRAACIYVRETRKYGTVVVEWRGLCPPIFQKFAESEKENDHV